MRGTAVRRVHRPFSQTTQPPPERIGSSGFRRCARSTARLCVVPRVTRAKSTQESQSDASFRSAVRKSRLAPSRSPCPGRLVGIERRTRGGEDLVASESPERDQRQQDCGADSRRPRFPADGRPRLAPGENQQRNRTSKPGERDRRQLPVPVLRGLDQIGHIASESRRRERLLPRNHAGRDREREQGREQPEPDRP